MFRTPLAFARSRDEGAPVDGFFLPRPDLAVGQEIDLEISFADTDVVFRGPGVVLWRRLSWSKTMRPGVGIEFAPGDPERRMLLFQFAESGLERPLVARPRRVASRIAVEYAAEGRPPRWTTIADVSAGGALLVGAGELAPGTILRLRIARPGATALRVEAVVAWSRPSVGAGVRFVAASDARRVAMEHIVDRSRAAVEITGGRGLIPVPRERGSP